MTTKVITISPDAPLEEAARIMVDNSIGGLPVVKEKRLVGIITETDVFKTILEMLGARESGIRLALTVADKPGVLSKITGAIAALGGDIIALGTFCGHLEKECQLMVKVKGVTKSALIEAMETIQAHVVDARTL